MTNDTTQRSVLLIGKSQRVDVDVTRLRLLRRRFAPKCLDLAERRLHLAGGLGAALAVAVKQRR